MNSKVAASIMCGDMLRLSNVLEALEKMNIDLIHVDIMDGSFVPNFTFGPDFCDALRRECKIPLDIHFMVNKPENYLELFHLKPGETASVHAESTVHLQRVLAAIHCFGAKAAVALNPATPIQMLEHVLPDVGMILIMTVNPGFAGQRLIPQTIEKIAECRRYLDQKGYADIEIEVDGNVSFENAARMKAAGANIFVSGSSGIFTKDLSFGNAVAKYRQCVAG
jgi:ribulose-phosphate 3-epimerase